MEKQLIHNSIILLLCLLLLCTIVSCNNLAPVGVENENGFSGESSSQENNPDKKTGSGETDKQQEKNSTAGADNKTNETSEVSEANESSINERNIDNRREEVPPELQDPGPNELGQVMVLMYHEIGHPEGEWRRTPENFRRDLQMLYEQGYRAVTLTDMVRGEINIPAGTSPVVFTFDDGNRGNFNYLEADEGPVLDPDCAV